MKDTKDLVLAIAVVILGIVMFFIISLMVTFIVPVATVSLAVGFVYMVIKEEKGR